MRVYGTGQANRAALARLDCRCVAGVDEAGRGPLAGPVVAAAVILDPEHIPTGLGDSKQLAAARRDALRLEVERSAVAWFVASATRAEIDSLNILNATLRAMRRAVQGLGMTAGRVLIDGNRAPALDDVVPAAEVQTLVGGDASEASISAASILAKTHRDALMVAYDARYPGYEFASNKGYATRAHLDALARLGPCRIHRNSFAPVRARHAERRRQAGLF
jgi:ribonuclease HII